MHVPPAMTPTSIAAAALLLAATAGGMQARGPAETRAGSGWAEHDGAIVPQDRLPPHMVALDDASQQEVRQLPGPQAANWRCTKATPPRLQGRPDCTIAMIVPTIGGVKTLELFGVEFRSIAATASSKCRLALFLSYDHPGDSWYADAGNRAAVEAAFRDAVDEPKRQWMELRWVANKGGRTYSAAVNAAAWAAHTAGFNYLYQIGDDVSFGPGSENWDTAFVEQLHRLDDFGLTGSEVSHPDRNLHYQERAFVGASHMCAFGTFFPPELHNVYTDNWISKIYQDLGRYSSHQANITNIMWNRYVIHYSAANTWVAIANHHLGDAMQGKLCDPSQYACA